MSAVQHVEDDLTAKLIAAIGREVTPTDMERYLCYHDRRFFAPYYQPRAFAYSVRRPEHAPEGIVTIEATPLGGGIAEPIRTFVSQLASDSPMTFTLDAATSVTLRADRYLHGWLQQRFSDRPASRFALVARARQFSCFVLLVGRITGSDQFEPTCGVLVQNSDELRIPLDVATIPSAKEFRDAVGSLSLEQQRFAKAVRSMQMESTLFGLCVVQVRPALERLLNLPYGSLTKEVALTHSLMDLFVEYQLPSDLLSYSGEPDAPVAAKIAAVSALSDRMMRIITAARDAQLKQAKEAKEMREASLPVAPPSPPPRIPLPHLPLTRPPEVCPMKEGYLELNGTSCVLLS